MRNGCVNCWRSGSDSRDDDDTRFGYIRGVCVQRVVMPARIVPDSDTLEAGFLLNSRKRASSARSHSLVLAVAPSRHFTIYGSPLKLLCVATFSMKSSALLIKLLAARYVYLPRKCACAAFGSCQVPLR